MIKLFNNLFLTYLRTLLIIIVYGLFYSYYIIMTDHFERIDLDDAETANTYYYLKLKKDAAGNVYFPLGLLQPTDELSLNNRRFKVTGQTANTLGLFYNEIYYIPPPDYYGPAPAPVAAPELNPDAGGNANKKSRKNRKKKRNNKTTRAR
jgi:hypothetical protein